jgi:RNA polymerase sigma-70 factor, ECF subfamily
MRLPQREDGVPSTGDKDEEDQDTEWLAAFRRGEPGGAAPLYERHGSRMKSIARNLLGTAEEAEDAVQEAFLKAFRSSAEFRGDARVSSWLYRLLVNTCYDLLRKRRRRLAPQPLDDAAEALSVAGPAEDHALRLSLERCLSLIGQRPRTAFLLYAVEGLSHREIGEVLEISEGGSKSLLFEARRQLQRCLLASPAERGSR